jgi:hypothetical protein
VDDQATELNLNRRDAEAQSLDKRGQKALNKVIRTCGEHVARGLMSDAMARTIICTEKGKLLRSSSLRLCASAVKE